MSPWNQFFWRGGFPGRFKNRIICSTWSMSKQQKIVISGSQYLSSAALVPRHNCLVSKRERIMWLPTFLHYAASRAIRNILLILHTTGSFLFFVSMASCMCNSFFSFPLLTLIVIKIKLEFYLFYIASLSQTMISILHKARLNSILLNLSVLWWGRQLHLPLRSLACIK